MGEESLKENVSFYRSSLTMGVEGRISTKSKLFFTNHRKDKQTFSSHHHC